MGYVDWMALQRLGWNEGNHRALNRFIATIGHQDIAVFDWDNTCIFGDIGEAVLRHQALHLHFKFTPEQLGTIIPDQVRGIDHVCIAGRSLPLPEIKNRIVAAYKKVFGRRLAAIRSNASYHDFSIGLLALNRGFEETPGIGCEFAYPWTVHFLQGFSADEVRRLAATVIGRELGAALRDRTRFDSRRQLLYRWRAGIRSFTEMADLARNLQIAGCRVIVSTASNPLIIETMIRQTGFAAEKVIGMSADSDKGILQEALAPVLAPNFGPGKVKNLEQLLDREPVFIAGDSEGDYDMLTAFPATRLKLLIRRQQPGKMAALYQKALAGDPRYLLQNVDPVSGRFSSGTGRQPLP